MSNLAETTGVNATHAAAGAATGQTKQQARSAAAATTCGVLPSPTDNIFSPCSKILQKHPKRMWQQDQQSTRPERTFVGREFDGGSGSDVLDEQLEQNVSQGVEGSETTGGGGRGDSFLEPKVRNRASGGAQDGDEKGAFWREVDLQLRVHPRPVPCLLPVVLGLTSRYRRAIMKELGWPFSTASPDIDEKAIRDPDPRKMCAEIARAKAAALVGRVDKPAILITADQVCLFDGDNGEEVREKPESADEAKGFLRSYSGRSVRTLSAVCVTNLETGHTAEGVHESEVVWRQIPPDVVDTVVERGLAMGSAGGFALEDPDLRLLVERVEGSVDSVLGLPVDLLCDLMKRAAHRVGA